MKYVYYNFKGKIFKLYIQHHYKAIELFLELA